DTEGVYILNTGYRTGSIFNTYTRHGLLFCPDNFTFMEQFDLEQKFDKENAIGTFTGKLADKGGLCPVDCDNVAYKRR
ncbi:MAG: hypothetical protein JNL60_00005, partial [Bacteroidia bacterium]|nr:hypothetical protein [Bacteroidia bacterium]